MNPIAFRTARVLQRLALLSCVFLTGCLGSRGMLHPHGSKLIVPDPTVPSELNMVALPPYVIGSPDVLLIDVYLPPKVDQPEKGPVELYPQPISGQHLVRMDGSVGLGIWGSVQVAGLTTQQASDAIRQFVFERIKNDPRIEKIAAPVKSADSLLVVVDVLSYNSKSYFVITDGAGYGEQVFEFPYQGNETVLSALAKVGGIPVVGSKRDVWVARRTPNLGQSEQMLAVDYVGITQHGNTLTNYQLFPGDRVYVKSQRIFRIDSFLQKALTPIERILGVTLLGSSTVNSIQGRGLGGGGF